MTERKSGGLTGMLVTNLACVDGRRSTDLGRLRGRRGWPGRPKLLRKNPMNQPSFTVIVSACLLALVCRSVNAEEVTLIDWGGNLTDRTTVTQTTFKGGSQVFIEGQGVREWGVMGVPFSLITPLTYGKLDYHATPVFGGMIHRAGHPSHGNPFSWAMVDDGDKDALQLPGKDKRLTAYVCAWRRTDFAQGRLARLGLSDSARLRLSMLAIDLEARPTAEAVSFRLWLQHDDRFYASEPVAIDRGKTTWDAQALAGLRWHAMMLREGQMSGFWQFDKDTVDAADLDDIQALGLWMQIAWPQAPSEVRLRHFTAQAIPGRAAPSIAERLEQTGCKGGLLGVMGVRADAAIMSEAAASGQYLVHGVARDWRRLVEARRALAAAGAFPAANVVEAPADGRRLPYNSESFRACLVQNDQLVQPISDEEIRRVLAFDGVALIREGTRWRELRQPLPADTDDWGHPFHGPERLPVSEDRHIEPVTGLKWVAGDTEYSNEGLRIAGGRVVSIQRGSHERGETGPDLWLVARDAASGVLLWRRALNLGNVGWMPHGYMSITNHLAMTADQIFCYPSPGGPMVAFEAATGRLLRSYDRGARLPKAKNRRIRSDGWRLADVNQLAYQNVLVRDGQVVQTSPEGLWKLDVTQGTVLFERPELKTLSFVSWIKDTIYAVQAGKPTAIIALDASTGATRWRTALPQQGKIQMYTDGDLVITVNGNAGINNTATIVALNADSGSERWRNDSNESYGWYRAILYPYQDRVWAMGAWQGDFYLDRKTGKEIGRHTPQAHGGGCGHEVVTPKYVLRGSFMVPRDDYDSSYVLNAVRPNCEIPFYPAYGQVFTLGSPCGCGWYLPGNTFSLDRTATVQPVADRDRRQQRLASPLAQSMRPPRANILTQDWRWTADVRGTSKGFLNDIHTMQGKRTKQQLPYTMQPFYTREWTDPVTLGEVQVRAKVSGQYLEARRGGELVWTFLAGSRISVAPVTVDGLIVFGCHDGWIYALQADGQIAWRYLAAPEERYLVAYGAIESVWPVFGVLLHDGKLYYQAGRSTALDEGLWAGALESDGTSLWRKRAAVFPAKFGDKEITAHGYQGFSSVGLGINAPLQFQGGKIYYPNNYHWWDLAKPKSLLVNQEFWIGGKGDRTGGADNQ